MMIDVLLGLLTGFWAVSFMSFLYKDNPFFRFSEHTLVGMRMGIVLIAAYSSIKSSGFDALFAGRWEMLVPIVLGLLVFTIFSKRTRWISFYPSALVIGIGIGLGLRGSILAQIIGIVNATIKPIILSQSISYNIDIIIIMIGTISALSYFIFTKEQTGSFGVLTKIGRAFIMVAMGSRLGKAGLSFLTPAQFSIDKLVTYPGIYVAIVAVIIIILDIIRDRNKG